MFQSPQVDFDEFAKSRAPKAAPPSDFGEFAESQQPEEETGGEQTREELPGATPRLKASVEAGKSPKIPLTPLEKRTPGEGISTKGAGSEWWNKLKQLAPSDPTEGRSVFDPKFWYNPNKAGVDPAHGGLAQAGDEASHEYDRARKAGSGIIPSIATAGVVGAGSLLGVSNKEEEEQAERGEGGKIIGGAAAPATVAALAPLVGPAVETGAKGLRAGVIRPIADTMADRFATPAVAPGLSDVAKANLEQPLARRGVEKVLRSSGMPSGQAGLRDAFSIAAPDLAEIERSQPIGKSGTQGGIIRPDMRLRQTVENIDNRLDDIWKKERQPQIERNAELPTLSREQLLGDATIDQLKRIEKTFKMDIPDQINLGDADKMLVKVNARLRRAEGMTPEARALALELSPDLQKFNEMKGELHRSIGDLLERVNEPGIKEFNRRYGALSEVRDALRNKMNPVEAERVLDSVRATGGLGRNVNLFERLHLKASPGRLAQKGLEDLSRSNLQIVPPIERPPVAGLLPGIPEPLSGPGDTSGPVRGGRWTTPAGLIEGIPPVEGEYIPPAETANGLPSATVIEPHPKVPTPFRVEAPRMRAGTIPPIEPVTSTTMLPGGAGVRNIKLLSGPTAEAPAAVKPIEPVAPKPAPIETKPVIPETKPVIPETPEEEAIPAEIKGITEPVKPKIAKVKTKPIEKRFTSEEIADAEGMLRAEAEASQSGEKPARYFDEVGQTDQPLKERPKEGTRIGGQWRSVSSGRNMFPFLRENPKVNAGEILKALRNKDSAAYSRLMERAVDFNKRHAPPPDEAYDFIRGLGGNPDAETEGIQEDIGGAEPTFNPEEIEQAPEVKEHPSIGLIKAIAEKKGGILPGMEEHVANQQNGAAKVAGENLTAEANTPKDISQAAGRMETHSPLFRGTEASPQREIFGNAPAKAELPATVAPVVQEAGWKFEGKNNLGQYIIRMPGTEVRLHLFERELQPDFIRRQIIAKEKQYGTPGPEKK